MGEHVSIDIKTRLQTFELSVDLQLPAKGVTVLFGPSGCGKTTLLRCVAGLHRADGKLEINQTVWQQGEYFVPVYQRNLGYIFQESQLFPHLDVNGNLQYGQNRVQHKIDSIQQQQVLKLLGIETLLDRKPSQLSGGEKQRVAIAQALLLNPKILLMDEPLSALDDARKREIMPYLERLRDELEIPVLYVTHSVDEMMRLADYLVVIDKGKVVAKGNLGEVLSSSDSPISLGEESGVVIEGKITERDLDWHLARLSFRGISIWARDMGFDVGSKIRFRVLARDVSLSQYAPTHSSIMNMLPVVVDEISSTEHKGIRLARVMIEDTPILARITARSIHQLDLKKGMQAFAQVKSVAIIE